MIADLFILLERFINWLSNAFYIVKTLKTLEKIIIKKTCVNIEKL